MPDRLFIRYQHAARSTSNENARVLAEVLWVEFKRPRGGLLSKAQLDWANKERARGALVWLATEDFLETLNGFREHYAFSGLMRRERWW
jgi:hypothetical protein